MQTASYYLLKYTAMVWLALGLRKPALAIFDEMLERWPDDGHALASRAHLHFQLQRPAQALTDLTRLVRVQPQVAAHWFNYGFALEAASRWEEALAAFTRATELDARLDRAWYGRGLVLIRLQRPAEAIEALRRNTELQPMSPYGWYQLARVHAELRDTQSALSIIRHLKGFEPKFAAQLERETGLKAGEASP